MADTEQLPKGLTQGYTAYVLDSRKAQRDMLAALLREHRYDSVKAVCECSDDVQVGLRCDPETHEQHVAGVLMGLHEAKAA